VLLLVAVGAFVLGVWASTTDLIAKNIIEPRLDRRSHAKLARQESAAKIWADRLVKGGYILHIRHAQREKWADSSAFDNYELVTGTDASKSSFSKATCITPQGVEEAKLIGRVFELAKVRISKVYSSPSCRAWQTALHAFGDTYTKDNSLLNRSAIPPEQRTAFAKRLRALIMGAEIAPGTNIALTGHGATIEWDRSLVLDDDQMDRRKPRLETGFFVLERVEDKLIARYKFGSIKEFATVMIPLPLDG